MIIAIITAANNFEEFRTKTIHYIVDLLTYFKNVVGNPLFDRLSNRIQLVRTVTALAGRHHVMFAIISMSSLVAN